MVPIRFKMSGKLTSCGESHCLKHATAVEVVVRAGTVTCYDGRLLHRSQAHASRSGPPRRVLYFTAMYKQGAQGRMTLQGESALHPQLRCAPLRNAPLTDLHLFTTPNATRSMRSPNELRRLFCS